MTTRGERRASRSVHGSAVKQIKLELLRPRLLFRAVLTTSFFDPSMINCPRFAIVQRGNDDRVLALNVTREQNFFQN